MRRLRFMSAAIGALGLATVAGGVVHADPIHVPTDAFSSQPSDLAPQPNRLGAQVPHHTMQWDAAKGRWGLKLDMTQPPDRNTQWRDAHLGAYYRLTPTLRVGVAGGLGDETPPETRKIDAAPPAPRVRLETTFKF